MKRFVVLGFAIISVFCGCDKSAAPPPAVTASTGYPSEPTEAQPKLQTIRLWLGPAEVNAEMALSAREEQTGLMFRTNLPEDDGMIFVFPYPQQASFWMKNCTVPLSCAYIGVDGQILEIHDLEPHNTNAVASAANNIDYVLEVNRDWFKRHGVSVGTFVRTEHGALADTFVRRQNP